MARRNDKGQINRKLKAQEKRIRAATEASIRATALEVDYRLRKRTPIDTGAAKANWKLGIGKASRGATKKRTDYAAAREEAIAAAAGLVLGMKVFFTNALKYIKDLEYGSSKQAPSGMIRITKAEVPKIAQTVGKAAFKAVMAGKKPPPPKRF